MRPQSKDEIDRLLDNLDPWEAARKHMAMVEEYGFTAPDVAQRHATIAQAYLMFYTVGRAPMCHHGTLGFCHYCLKELNSR